MIVRIIPVAVVLSTFGCDPAEKRTDVAPPLLHIEELASSPPTGTGGGPPATDAIGSRDDAIERIARARCDRLRSCPSVVADRYKTAEVCLGRERAHIANMWSEVECRRIDTAALEACESEARAEKCTTRGESLFTPIVGACAGARVCPVE